MFKLLPVAFVFFTVFVVSGVAGQTPQEAVDTGRIAELLGEGTNYLYKDATTLRQDSAVIFFARALQLSDSLRVPSWRDRTLVLLGTRYLYRGVIKQGKYYFMQAIDTYHKDRNLQAEADAWLLLGKAIPAVPEVLLPEKAQAYEHARELYGQLGQAVPETDALKGIAETDLNQGKLDVAENELLHVLQLYRSLGYPKLFYTYDLLADLCARRNDEQKELVYRMQSIRSMEATGDTLIAHYDYSRLAVIYRDLSMWNESVQWITRSLESMRRLYEFGDFYGDLNLLIQDLLKLGRTDEALAILQKDTREVPPANLSQQVDLNEMFGNCYSELQQYDKAEEYYAEMLNEFSITSFNEHYYSTKAMMTQDFVHYYEVVSAFYIRVRQYQKAGVYLKKLLDLSPGEVPPITLIHIHHMQFTVDSASGNYISAIRQYELHKALNDSVFTASKNKQIAELQIEYKTNQKDQSIKMLEMQSKSQETELQKANLQRDITIAGIFGVLIIAGLAYNGYRNKQRSNQTLQLKQREINQQNLSLQHLVKEKEWLLKEVHHRVKNNLQIIISLLNTQTDFLDNPSALHAIQDSRERMQAIALIHQKLYQQDHSTLIDMHSYIHELISYLMSSFDNTGRLYFDLDIDEISLDVSQAVPLGLILNEAITNAVKYAFPRGGRGTVAVQLYREGVRGILLRIADNGIGLPQNADLSGNTSLGIQLMKLFAEQLEGQIRMQSEHGVEICLRFKQQFAPE